VADPDELLASRARIADARIDERRAFERALHDGVQQDLVALAVQLQLARELVVRGESGALEALDDLRREVHDALDRARRLADEIYPSTLDARGLVDALRNLQGVRVGAVGRLPRRLEATIVLCCRALVAGSTGAIIEVREEGDVVRIEVAGADADETVRDLVQAAGGSIVERRAGEFAAAFPMRSR
jgi:signal transduction histidine kinase